MKIVAMLLVCTVMLVACGKSDEQIKSDAAAVADTVAKAREEAAAKAAEAKSAQEERAQERARVEAEKIAGYKSAVDTLLVRLDDLAQAKEVLPAAMIAGLEGVRQGQSDVLFGNFAWLFVESAMDSQLPKYDVTVSALFPLDVVNDAKARIKTKTVSWLVKNQSALNPIWAAVRPLLRQQYGLLSAVRKQQKLLAKPYNRAGFDNLRECFGWYEMTSRQNEGEPVAVDEADKKRCEDEFKKFGVPASFALASTENYDVRNAHWLLRFLDRREADGGEDFAKRVQQLMLDYVK